MTLPSVNGTGQNEITILARVLDGESGQMPPDVARHVLELGFSEAD